MSEGPPGGKMVDRMWHGRVPSSKAQAYREFLNARAIPDYRLTPVIF